MTLIGAGEPERLSGAEVTANYLNIFGVRPSLGRSFAVEEEEYGRDGVVVLSASLWKRRFDADPAILGKKITLDGVGMTVIGVMPSEFRFPAGVEIWKPLTFAGPRQYQMRSRDWHLLRVIGRLRPGVTLEQADGDLHRISHHLEFLYPKTNTDWSVSLTPLQEQLVGKIRLTLLVLFAAVSCVLLIACANVANLLLARGAARQKEFALRAALGAGRVRVIRQLLTESLLLSFLGGVGGVLVAHASLRLLTALGDDFLPRAGEIALSAPVLSFALVVVVLTGLLFGLAPALQSTRVDLTAALSDGNRGSGVRSKRTLRGLVVGEVALAMILLIGAGLLIQSFMRLHGVDRGFDVKNLLTLRIDFSGLPATTEEKRTAFFQELQQRVSVLPGVEAVGTTSTLPLAGQSFGLTFKIDNRGTPESRPDGDAHVRLVNENYFRAMRIPLVRGRGFDATEVHNSAHVAVISQTFARRFFGSENPLGKRLRVDLLSPDAFEIIGIVGDIRHRALEVEFYQTIYLPTIRATGINLVIRTSNAPSSLAAAVRRQVSAMDPNQPISNVKTLEQWMSESLTQPRIRTWVLGVLSSVALLIAVVGIYGVMAYVVTQRTYELGIRMALGASEGEVAWMVLRQGMFLTFSGIFIGILAALALTRLMRGLLFEVGPTDTQTFAEITALLIGAGLLACWLPARRAARVDPIISLRSS